MRPLLLALAVLHACDDGGGPSPDDDVLDTWSVGMDTQGLALLVDGRDAVTGSGDGVIAFSTATGTITGRLDGFPSARAQDAWGVVAAFGSEGAWLWAPPSGDPAALPVDDGLSAPVARLWSGGAAWIGRTTQECTVYRTGVAAVVLDGCEPLGDVAVDRGAGTLYVGQVGDPGAPHVVAVEPGGIGVDIATGADRLAWDPTADLLYAGTEGGDTIQAWEPDGSLAWEVALDSPLVALAALGTAGGLAVVVESTGEPVIALLDPAGDQVRDIGGPLGLLDLAASPDGGTLAAVTRDDRVVFFRGDWDAL